MDEKGKNENGVGLIFQKIPAIMAEVGAIGKDRQNQQQRYNFRGIDDVYNAIHAILAKHGVFTVPEALEATHEERHSKGGGVLIYRIYKVRYRFYADDGSFVDSVVYGEGMDSGDKAGNKAMSGAHKYALLQVFAIPTDDPKDSEDDSPQVNGKPRQQLRAAPPDDYPDDGGISDLADQSEEEMNMLKSLAETIKGKVEDATLDYGDFKKYLARVQSKSTPPRVWVGKQFGNLSISAGRLTDVKFLNENLDHVIGKYVSTKEKQAAKAKEKSEAGE